MKVWGFDKGNEGGEGGGERDVQLMIQIILHVGGFLGVCDVDVDVDDVDAVLVDVAGVLAHAGVAVSRAEGGTVNWMSWRSACMPCIQLNGIKEQPTFRSFSTLGTTSW